MFPINYLCWIKGNEYVNTYLVFTYFNSCENSILTTWIKIRNIVYKKAAFICSLLKSNNNEKIFKNTIKVN